MAMFDHPTLRMKRVDLTVCAWQRDWSTIPSLPCHVEGACGTNTPGWLVIAAKDMYYDDRISFARQGVVGVAPLPKIWGYACVIDKIRLKLCLTLAAKCPKLCDVRNRCLMFLCLGCE